MAPELLTDGPAAETPTAMYSWGEQRGKPVLTGCICPYSFLEPPTAFQQPSDCLTLRFPQRPYGKQQSAAKCQWRNMLQLSSTVTRIQFSSNKTKLYFALVSSFIELSSGFLYFCIYHYIHYTGRSGGNNSQSWATGHGIMAITEWKTHTFPFMWKFAGIFRYCCKRDCKYFWLYWMSLYRAAPFRCPVDLHHVPATADKRTVTGDFWSMLTWGSD